MFLELEMFATRKGYKYLNKKWRWTYCNDIYTHLHEILHLGPSKIPHMASAFATQPLLEQPAPT